ncbi:HSP90 family protein [Ammonicoccus fulvus]|uniref:HSP90 family protein n=1 Tax=Ammonicoccus fulvus TaxID=3138240 RepID=A0ABZ3FPD3_9ACTN
MTSSSPAPDRFQVNLHGLIELLSEHLYSGPQVFVRELLQNGIDALHMRPDAPTGADPRPGIVLDAPGDRLTCYDSGCGLSPDDVETFLITVGRSAKRDDLGLARTDLIGQFGIGVLSCFLVSGEINVLSRSSEGEIVAWRATGDGTYRTRAWPDIATWADENPTDPEAHEWLDQGPGTIVRLAPRPDTRGWFAPDRIARLAREYAGHADADIRLRVSDREIPIGRTPWPWTLPARERIAWARENFGTTPLATFPVTVAAAGLHGLAVVAGDRITPGISPRHRVHIKGMRVLDGEADLLPPWGFFVSLVVNGDLLHPTAAREQLRDDELLAETRDELGRQVMAWLLRTARGDRDLFNRFLTLHHTGLKALAVACDTDDFLALVQLLPFSSTVGERPLPDLLTEHDDVLVADSVDEFRQMAAVATAQGTPLVNAGYAYDGTVIERYRREAPAGQRLIPVEPERFAATIDSLEPARRAEVAPLSAAAQRVLDEAGVRVEIRRFAPESVPALLLDSSHDRHRRLSRATETSGDLWAGLLQAVDDRADARPRLILNDANPMVRRLVGVDDLRVLRPAVQAVYARALLQGQHPVSAGDARMIEHAFGGLLELALTGTERS